MTGRIITPGNPNPKLPTDEVRLPQRITWEQMVAVVVNKLATDKEVTLIPEDFNDFMDKKLVLMNAVSEKGISLKVMEFEEAKAMMKAAEGGKQ